MQKNIIENLKYICGGNINKNQSYFFANIYLIKGGTICKILVVNSDQFKVQVEFRGLRNHRL